VNEVADHNINVTVSRAVLKRRSQWNSVQPHGKKGERPRFESRVVIDVDAEAEKEQKKKRKEAKAATGSDGQNEYKSGHLYGTDAGIEGKHEFP
jgi:hypothetical protein